MEELVNFEGSQQTFKRKLDTRGCCFLCLQVVEIKSEEEDKEEGEETIRKTTEGHTVSLKSLRRYLKIDTDKLPGSSSSLNTDKPSSSSSLKKEEDIKVDVCKSCAIILNKFSNVFSTFEMIQAEMNYWLERIHQRIPDAANNDSDSELIQNFYRRMNTTGDDENAANSKAGSSSFAEVLRNEIAMKCSKLKTNLEAKVELTRAKTPKDPSTVFLILEKPSTSFPPATPSWDEDTASLTASTPELEDEFECEDVKYVPPPKTDEEIDLQTETEDPADEKPATRRPSRTKTSKNKPSSSSKVKKPSETKPFYVYSSKTGMYSCTKCLKKLTSRRGAHGHYYSAHLKIKQGICEVCGATFSHPGYLSRHKKICKKKPIVTKYRLNENSGKFECVICNKEFPTKGTAGTHYNQAHEIKDRKYKCEICNVSAFIAEKHLIRHQKTCQDNLDKEKFNQVDPKRKWPCPICGKRFSRRNEMNNHQRVVHLKERNHQCDLCKKCYSSPQILEDHKRVVHFRKNVYCKFCTKCYAYGKTFLDHERKCGKKKAEEVDNF